MIDKGIILLTYSLFDLIFEMKQKCVTTFVELINLLPNTLDLPSIRYAIQLRYPFRGRDRQKSHEATESSAG